MNLRTLLLAAVLCLLPALSLAAAPNQTSAERPDLARYFDERGLVGCFVVQTPQGLVRVNPERAGQGFRPASTFKILNALVALEQGVAHDTGKVLRWDGVRREVPLWNSDLSMNEAFRSSAVWYFEEIARQNGREALGKAMAEVGYGNADASGSDRFWLDGPLRISADGQVRFLARFLAGEVPFFARHRLLVARMMLLQEGQGEHGPWALYAKTGLAASGGGEGGGDEELPVGWIVGWAESSGAKYPFALNLGPRRGGQGDEGGQGATPGPELIRARLDIARALLGELGLLPRPAN